MLPQLETVGPGLCRTTGGVNTAAAIGLAKGGEPVSGISGSACSPPRATYVTRVLSSTTVTAPSRTVVVSKRKRRRRGGADAGDSGGDDDGPGDGGNWGENWDNGDGDEDGSGPWQVQNIWAWQIICIGSLLQAAHYLMMQQSNNNPESHNRRTMKFAAVSSTAQ